MLAFRRNWVSAILKVALVLSLADSISMAQDLRLVHDLVLEDLQEGFAGVTGTRWTCGASGTWTVQSIFNDELTLVRQGVLDGTALCELSNLLRESGYRTLPREMGSRSAVNGHNVRLSFGRQIVSCWIAPEESLQSVAKQKSAPQAWQRMAAITAVVERITKTKESSDGRP